jgi:hypothetical protein
MISAITRTICIRTTGAEDELARGVYAATSALEYSNVPSLQPRTSGGTASARWSSVPFLGTGLRDGFKVSRRRSRRFEEGCGGQQNEPCCRKAMVRRGSTVRVRQRALVADRCQRRQQARVRVRVRDRLRKLLLAAVSRSREPRGLQGLSSRCNWLQVLLPDF